MNIEPTSKFPKTLVLSRSVPPTISGSSVIIGNLAQQFRPEEMIILGGFSLNSPNVKWKKEWAKLKYPVCLFPDGWRGARWVRWAQWPTLIIQAFLNLKIHKCTAILAVYPDESFLLAGYILSRLCGMPLYVYFHNTYLENRTKSWLAGWLQPRLFERAKHVFVMSEGMQALYRKKYFGLSCSPLLHSFNETLPDPDEVHLPPIHQPLKLVLFGNVNASNAEAASRIAQLVHIMPDVRLTILSGTSRSYLRKIGFTGRRIKIETLSRQALLRRFQDEDIVLLPHGFYGPIAVEEIATIFPTRTIDALISCRPILAHLPGDCFLSNFLQRHDCALIVDKPSVDSLRDDLVRLIEDPKLRIKLVRNALKAAQQFRAPSVAAHMRNILNETGKCQSAQNAAGLSLGASPESSNS